MGAIALIPTPSRTMRIGQPTIVDPVQARGQEIRGKFAGPYSSGEEEVVMFARKQTILRRDDCCSQRALVELRAPCR